MGFYFVPIDDDDDDDDGQPEQHDKTHVSCPQTSCSNTALDSACNSLTHILDLHRQAAMFWSRLHINIAAISSMEDRTYDLESFFTFLQSKPGLKSVLDLQIAQSTRFWASLQQLSENYCKRFDATA